jgi:hypothetical protein
VLVLAIATIVALLGDSITTDSDVTADTESRRANELIGQRLSDPD